MALSLNAEQKELLKIFKIEEQYVIPSYQRPYSWEYDQCIQLYNDLLNSFDEKQDYFIGNIIIAKAENNKETLEVIDGQQRLITTLLLFKILYLLQPEIKSLGQLLEKEDWEGNNTIPRIRSAVFEANDDYFLKTVLDFDLTKIEERIKEVSDKSNKISERLCNSRFEANTLFFYSWLKYYQDRRTDLKEFTSYLLKQVYLLPIELTGPTQDEANEKALVIFETINNRGMNLEDADIFKAKLYNKAKNVKEQDIFIESWTEFKSNCDALDLKIDDIFRFYSHIIRGKQGITTTEISIREFFINEKYSPFELKKYKDVMSDLFKIIGILELINIEKIRKTKIAKWLQVLEAYTNQYPKLAIVNYLFVNELLTDDSLEDFLLSLIRYVYFQGSTTTVKFEIYNIIKRTSQKEMTELYLKSDVTSDYFNNLGRLKKGFALLAFYLNESYALPSYNIDKIITLNDKASLTDDWNEADLSVLIDSLGNFIVLDIPKKGNSVSEKAKYFTTSELKEVKSIFINGGLSYESFKNRDLQLKTLLVDFFKGTLR